MLLRGRLPTALAALVALGAVDSAPLGAQARGVTVFVYGGSCRALRDLNGVGTDRFGTRRTVGAGVGYEVDRNVELRATLTEAASQFVESGVAHDKYLNRYYVAGEAMYKYPFASGVMPYGFLGFGAVRLHETGTRTTADKIQGFADVGVGVAYRVRKSGWSLFVQGVGFFYSLTGMTTPTFTRFNRAQVDAAWTAGAAYRVAL